MMLAGAFAFAFAFALLCLALTGSLVCGAHQFASTRCSWYFMRASAPTASHFNLRKPTSSTCSRRQLAQHPPTLSLSLSLSLSLALA